LHIFGDFFGANDVFHSPKTPPKSHLKKSPNHQQLFSQNVAIHWEAVVYSLSGKSWEADGQQGSVATTVAWEDGRNIRHEKGGDFYRIYAILGYRMI
jgi:hypothetical protein